MYFFLSLTIGLGLELGSLEQQDKKKLWHQLSFWEGIAEIGRKTMGKREESPTEMAC
jgi:hypothetical protein